MARKVVEILVYGTGAVGAIFAACCQGARARVTTVCRSNYDTVRSRGFQIRSSTWGNSTFHPHRVVRNPSEVHDIAFDYVVCANKATADEAAMNDISDVVRGQTTLVTAQNGVDPESRLLRAYTNNPILSAVCYAACTQSSPGIIHQYSQIRPHAFHIGMCHGGSKSIGETKLLELIALNPGTFKQVKQIKQEHWTKLLWNAAFNPLCAIFGLNSREVLDTPLAARLAEQVMTEVCSVARAIGVTLPVDLPSKTLDATRKAPPVYPSMLQDAEKRRPLEIDALNGNIWRLAEQYRVNAHTIKAIHNFLIALDADTRCVLTSGTNPLTSNAKYVPDPNVSAGVSRFTPYTIVQPVTLTPMQTLPDRDETFS